MIRATTETVTALRQALSRHPALVATVRAAATLVPDLCQIVTFEGDRAFIVAASGGDVLQPRPLVAAERSLLFEHAESPEPDDPVTRSYPIISGLGGLFGALTVHGPVPEPTDESLAALARVVSGVAAGAIDETTAEETGLSVTNIVNGLRDAIIVLDADFTVRWVNDAIGSLLLRSPADLLGKSAIEFIHPDDLAPALDAMGRLSSGLKIYRLLLRVAQGDGVWGRVEVTGTDQTDNPKVRGIVLSLRNADLALEIEDEQIRSEHMSQVLVEQLQDAIVATDAVGAITLVNRAGQELFGLDPDTPPSHLSWRDLPLLDPQGRVVDGDRHPVRAVVGADFDQAQEMSVVSRRGGHHYVSVQQRDVHADDGSLLGSVVSFHDVTEARRAQTELVSQALHDQLTGLPNRRMLSQRLLELEAQEGERHRTVAACFLDLDHFKLVNDTHGHRTGDHMIRTAAQRLTSQLRHGDLLIRQGGDEFVALLFDPESDAAAVHTSDRLRAALAEPFQIDGTRFDLTASAGVSVMTIAQLDEDTLLRQADIALYAAKARGRNRTELFDNDLAVTTEIEERQRRMLRHALDNDGIVMHFQPLVESSTGKTSGFEALARCIDEDGSLLGPSSFLDAVAGSGLVWDLDRRAFELSCSAAAVLRTVVPDEPPIIACNFSPVSIVQPEFVDYVTSTAEAAGVPASQLCIEITESAAFAGGDASLGAVVTLHEAGFLVALDDFGTGYSSLSHLRDLPLTSVKVDRSFVAKLTERTSERAIAEAVVGLAGDLGLGIVAEGVEDESQLEAAQDLGFSVMQGWHYAAAMSLDEVIGRWLGLTRPESDVSAKNSTENGSDDRVDGP